MLERAVRSVLEQSYPEVELIVVSDGSDVDLSVVQDLVHAHGQTFLEEPHRGVAAARNRGVAISNGTWLAFLDSDDCWLPDKLLRQMEFHEANPEIRLSQCEEIWYRDGRRVNKKVYHELPEGNAFFRSIDLCCISASSIMLHRNVFLESGGFDEHYPVCEDYELWLRLSLLHQFGLVHEKLVKKYGGHPDQLSKALPAMDRFRLFALVSLYRNEVLGPDQASAVRDGITAKAEVLATGAEKRALASASIYRSVLSLFKDEPRQDALDSILEELTPVVFLPNPLAQSAA